MVTIRDGKMAQKRHDLPEAKFWSASRSSCSVGVVFSFSFELLAFSETGIILACSWDASLFVGGDMDGGSEW